MKTIENILKILLSPSPAFVVLVIILFVILAGRADRAEYYKYLNDTLSSYSAQNKYLNDTLYWYYHNEADVDLVVNDENCSKIHFCYASENNESLDDCPIILSKYKEVGAIGQRRFLEKCTTLKINKLKKMYLN
jgi:hypothetical protein